MEAPAGPPRRVELVEITPETVRRVGELDRAFSQRRFVSSVYQSYGDALVPPTARRRSRHDRGSARSRRRRAGRIHDGCRADADPAPSVPLAADGRLAPSRSRHRPRRDRGARRNNAQPQGATHLLLSCTAGVTGSPEPFYRRLGFERTGTVNEWGETEMIAPLDRLLPAHDNGESGRSPRCSRCLTPERSPRRPGVRPCRTRAPFDARARQLQRSST